MTERISADALEAFLRDHPGWSAVDDRIHRNFVFRDFVFMTRADILAERVNHDPDWRNVCGKVGVDLTTHEAGGPTRKDLDVAAEMDRAAD